MDCLLYWIVRCIVGLVGLLPLRLVARLGRAGGGLSYYLDRRHRRVAHENLRLCFGTEMSEAERREVARENFRRIGENYASAIKCAFMTAEELRLHCDFVGVEHLLTSKPSETAPSRVV